MENRCAHSDSPLHDGELRGCVIVCPAHGWDFDVRTGFKPGDADGFPIPCFAVEVRGGEIWVDVEEIINRRRSRRASEEPGPAQRS
jgi:3-phenylpropionate/trans-cinnamate dioxygenase ferredoxin subunit